MEKFLNKYCSCTLRTCAHRQKWEEQDMIDNPSTASACNGGASKIPQADFFTRLATHEARGAKSNQLVNFLPITFLIFGGGLGMNIGQSMSR